MKNEFVAVVEKPVAVDRFVVADGEIARQPGGGAGGRLVDGYRLEPVNDVLQPEVLAGRLRDVERGPGIARLAPDVQEKRSARFKDAAGCLDPPRRPVEVLGRGQVVAITGVLDPQVVRR